MPNFHYKAMNDMGKLIQGRFEATNDADLETRLGKMKLELVGFREQKQGAK